MACNCTTTNGLMILPINYCITSIERSLPKWAEHSIFTKTKLNHEYHYDLRVLREGFVYLFYEKGEQGTNYWEVYSVSENGLLWKQNNVQLARQENNDGCAPSLTMPAKAEFICIESPQQCGKVWLAFSEKKWSQDILNLYAKNSTLRSQRMMMINPNQMHKNQFSAQGVTQLTSTSLADIIDYREEIQFNTVIADPTFKGQEKLVKDKLVDWNSDFLLKHKTAYPWQLERKSEYTEQAAKQRSIDYIPSYIVCLSDALGIAYELNGWSNEVIGNFELFTKEREHECQSDALQSLFEETLMNLNKESSKNSLAIYEGLHRETSNPWLDKVRINEGSSWLRKRRELYQVSFAENPAMLSALMAGCDLYQQWLTMPDIASNYYQRLDTAMYNAQHKKEAGQLQSKIAQLKRKSSLTAVIAQDTHKADVEQIPVRAEKEYQKYADMINQEERALFHQKYQAILEDVKTLHEQRSENLFTWLQSDVYFNTLNDFSNDNKEDGIAFERVIVNSIWGSHDSKIGSDVIGDWLNSYEIPHTNLFWRAIAFNQTDAINDLKQLFSSINLDAKLDSDDKLQGIINTLSSRLQTFTGICQNINERLKKPLPASTSIFDKNLRKADKLAAIFISKVSGYIPSVVDSIHGIADSTRYMVAQRILMGRAGIESAVVKAIYEENYLEKSWRQRVKDLIRKGIDPIFSQRPHVDGTIGVEARRYLNDLSRTNLKMLLRDYRELSDEQIMQKKLGILRSDYNKTDLSSITESRFSAILLLFQLPSAYFLLVNSKKEGKPELTVQWLGVISSSISLLSDLIIRPMELSYGSEANRVMSLRFIGGFAVLGASIFGVVYNFMKLFDKNNELPETLIYASYIANFGAITIKGILILALSEELLKKALSGLIGKFITFFAAWYVQFILLIIDILWSNIKKDDFQKWIIKTRFGHKFDPKQCPNFETELTQFKELLEINDEQNSLTDANTELLIRLGVLNGDLTLSPSLTNYFNITLKQSPIAVPFRG